MKHIYYGDGKGKTTAAIGLAVRAAGSKMKVLFVQFLKTEFSGERHILSHTENVTLTFCPLELKFTFDMDDKEKAQAAKIFKGIFDNAVTTALTEKYDMVVLDEVFEAINAHMLSESEVYEFITNAPSSMEIVMTGHNPPQKFMDCADYITEFKKIKHPYDRGITGRIGIDRAIVIGFRIFLGKEKGLAYLAILIHACQIKAGIKAVTPAATEDKPAGVATPVVKAFGIIAIYFG